MQEFISCLVIAIGCALGACYIGEPGRLVFIIGGAAAGVGAVTCYVLNIRKR